ncbi:hypothetical protein [Laspinema olomoucense]|uniref:hypothetical protein n=1 Tax=Laspinema olomoucense TaxID=3231600 RepID=UPI0021BA4732|nr:hypothetical protein [Laspinema sp. D3c]MCT7992854.1 hypothetical protein [Laspinema sp. D3c]
MSLQRCLVWSQWAIGAILARSPIVPLLAPFLYPVAKVRSPFFSSSPPVENLWKTLWIFPQSIFT